MINNMTDLLDRIEDRLGMSVFTLPTNLAKPKWADIIKRDSLTTYSRYFPHKIVIDIDTSKSKGGFYLIDDNICRDFVILGVGDIDWSRFGRQTGAEQSMGFGAYDFLSNNYGLDDIPQLQMRADHTSFFDNNIYIKFERPNRIKLETVTGQDVSRFMNTFPIELFVKNFDNLSTISPGQMETFDNLAISDVAIFLYNRLKYFDGLETIFGSNVDLKLSELQAYAESRKDMVQELKDNYISAGNKNQHLIMCV